MERQKQTLYHEIFREFLNNPKVEQAEMALAAAQIQSDLCEVKMYGISNIAIAGVQATFNESIRFRCKKFLIDYRDLRSQPEYELIRSIFKKATLVCGLWHDIAVEEAQISEIVLKRQKEYKLIAEAEKKIGHRLNEYLNVLDMRAEVEIATNTGWIEINCAEGDGTLRPIDEMEPTNRDCIEYLLPFAVEYARQKQRLIIFSGMEISDIEVRSKCCKAIMMVDKLDICGENQVKNLSGNSNCDEKNLL